MPSVLKRRSLFQTDIDPDAIKIDILGDEKLCGSLILSSEDLRMLVRIYYSFNKETHKIFRIYRLYIVQHQFPMIVFPQNLILTNHLMKFINHGFLVHRNHLQFITIIVK
jgi:hypothetical protein